MAPSMYRIYLLTVVVFLMYIINQFLREIDVKNNEQLGTKLSDDSDSDIKVYSAWADH